MRFLGAVVSGSQKAFLATFGPSLHGFTGITNDPVELQAGMKQIGEARISGSTALFDSLIEVMQVIPSDQRSRKTLLVISDFEDNSSHHSLDDAILRAQQTGTAIFAFMRLGEDPRRSRSANRGLRVAQRLAEETGGEAYRIESPKDMEIALQHLQLLLKSSYAVKYHASATPNKNGNVPLKIEVHRKDASVVAAQRGPAGNL